MIGKSIDEITEKDLQVLIDNAVVERKTMEYKQLLPSNSDSDKKEFLADVSSLANASGGDLIFGIIEDRETGAAKILDGLTIANVDQEVSRLESMIRDGIEPRILGIICKPVILSNSKTALILRIPKSWISPHRVSFRGHDKFYSRSTNGKYSLDVAELRVAFSLSGTLAERIRAFREDRISAIYAGETPIPTYHNPKIVLHLIPISSFSPAQIYDITKYATHLNKMKPMYCSGWNYRYNFDGFLTYSLGTDGTSYSYVQFFKNGIIEAVEGSLLEPYEGKKLIPSYVYERELIGSLPTYLSVLRSLNVELPIFAFLTLLGVRGYSMGLDRTKFFVHEIHSIDRDFLLAPEIIVDNYEIVAKDVLKPSFDSIWNACGLPRSLNYDDSGNWGAK